MKYPERYLLKMDTKLKEQLEYYSHIEGKGAKADFLRNQAKKGLTKFIKEQAKKDDKLAQTFPEWRKEQNK